MINGLEQLFLIENERIVVCSVHKVDLQLVSLLSLGMYCQQSNCCSVFG